MAARTSSTSRCIAVRVAGRSRSSPGCSSSSRSTAHSDRCRRDAMPRIAVRSSPPSPYGAPVATAYRSVSMTPGRPRPAGMPAGRAPPEPPRGGCPRRSATARPARPGCAGRRRVRVRAHQDGEVRGSLAAGDPRRRSPPRWRPPPRRPSGRRPPGPAAVGAGGVAHASCLSRPCRASRRYGSLWRMSRCAASRIGAWDRWLVRSTIRRMSRVVAQLHAGPPRQRPGRRRWPGRHRPRR